MARKKIGVMITAFRDGFQSVFGARVLTRDFLPALEAAARTGITHFEIGGGARFQSLYFYCNEDAFQMMDTCRSVVGPETNLQTLARGINVVGLESQSSDIIEMHARLFKKHGITTIRNFDALNDVDNLDYSGRCIVEAGLKHEICVSLMALPPGVTGAHTPEFYAQTLKDVLEAKIPFDSVCYKDASGTSTPKTVYESVKLARAMLPAEVPLRFHTHETAGVSVLCNMAALEAGADGLDLSMAPVSGGTGQPDVVTMWHALRDTPYDLGVDVDKLLEAEEVFKDCMKDYFMPPEAIQVEPLIPFSPMPGGALTANTQMMRDHNILDRFPEVIAAMGEVVARGGFATSVTPVSQFYFQQAFNNVIFGPWKKIADGYGKMVLGYFGRTPAKPDPEIVALCREQMGLEPTTKSPRQMNDEDPAKGRAPAEKMLREAGLPLSDENIFIAATCRGKGIRFLKGEAETNVRKRKPEAPQPGKQAFRIQVDDSAYTVLIDGDSAVVDGRPYRIAVQEASAEEAAAPGAAAAGGAPVATAAPATGGAAGVQAASAAAAPAPSAAPAAADFAAATAIKAPLPGLISKVPVRAGAQVRAGDTVIVLESMKMETDITTPKAGTVSAVDVAEGDQVSAGQILVRIL